jgi:hypothetical protein
MWIWGMLGKRKSFLVASELQIEASQDWKNLYSEFMR